MKKKPTDTSWGTLGRDATRFDYFILAFPVVFGIVFLIFLAIGEVA